MSQDHFLRDESVTKKWRAVTGFRKCDEAYILVLYAWRETFLCLAILLKRDEMWQKPNESVMKLFEWNDAILSLFLFEMKEGQVPAEDELNRLL